MPIARKRQIFESQPGFYHCISRCVRRAWLCGVDPLTEKNFDHRRDWLIARMILLSKCFAIDVYAYSVMSNHVHTVLYVDPGRVSDWSDDEVIRRWKMASRWRKSNPKPLNEKAVSPQQVAEWRRRLGNVSWYMQLLKEPLARIANAEEQCSGRFWEGRFRSIPLLDEAAVVACMAYVDLNPIRANVATKLENSDFTSIQMRLMALAEQDRRGAGTATDSEIKPIGKPDEKSHLPVRQTAYVELVRSSAGQRLAEDNAWRDALVRQIGMRPSGWSDAVSNFLVVFRSGAGSESMLAAFMETMGRASRFNSEACTRIYR